MNLKSSMSNHPVKPEILAPAGDWDCVRAAIENGADAIYFGVERFNARMRAANFTSAEMPALMEHLHRRGVRGYLTFNILVFENEMAEAEEFLRSAIAAGVDAVVVQDVGICRLIRSISPDFPIHASTQMTVTSPDGVAFAREIGCSLVVLARECSIAEIGRIQTADPGMSLEVFVHGALCVAYSGQCLTSESLGGRSANRGVCAQACRMPYDLICDGVALPLDDRRYLLSPQDLTGVELLPELIRAGVASLKIEGRLKAPEYVANMTHVYRHAIDAVWERMLAGDSPEALSKLARDLFLETRYDVEMAFSRGLFTGWMRGTDNRQLVHARFGKKRGVFLGEVTGVSSASVRVRLEGPLKAGDGVVFDAGRPEETEEGGRVYVIRQAGRPGKTPAEVDLEFGRDRIDFRNIHAGDKLWKTSDPVLERRWRQCFEGEAVRFQRPMHLEIAGSAGQPLALVARDDWGNTARVESAQPLVIADKQPLTDERLREQLGRLGGTPFRLGEFRNNLAAGVLLPVSELNRLRREVVSRLLELRATPAKWTLLPEREAASDLIAPSVVPAPVAPRLIALARNLDQLEAILRCGIGTVYCELEDPKQYRKAVQSFRDWQMRCQGCGEAEASPQPVREIFVAPPRIAKPGEDWILEQVRASNADGYLVRNFDHLRFFAGERCVGDYSLNIANRFAAGQFMNGHRLERVTASYDLNFQQLEALLRAAPPEWFEVCVHQHMPMFHMEHCLFCAFLSEGRDYHDCGRPCDRHAVELRDHVGMGHPVKADAGCRNTVFNAVAQTGAEYMDRLVALGVRHFRLEFLNESPDEVIRTLGMYRKLLRGETSGARLWRELNLSSQLGVARGTISQT